ncbi:MAG: YicC/YloC family endoribonuclease [Terriglobia bacterium]
MLRSMTGFAQEQKDEGPWVVRVRLKGVNHRFLDLRMRVPPELEPAEPALRRLLRERLRRGHVDVQFGVENTTQAALEVDAGFVRSYLELYRRLQKEHQLSGEPDLTAALRLPGVLRSGLPPEDRQARALAALAQQTLLEALERLDEMRRAEGEALERELHRGLMQVQEARKQLVALGERALPACQRRLQERLQELLDQSGLDPARLAEEAAYLAARSDVQEELTRLASHAEQFARLLGGEGAVGKRLDFLLQEMNREANTLLSKASGLDAEGLEMTRLGLELKAQIEQLREQVQNVE